MKPESIQTCINWNNHKYAHSYETAPLLATFAINFGQQDKSYTEVMINESAKKQSKKMGEAIPATSKRWSSNFVEKNTWNAGSSQLCAHTPKISRRKYPCTMVVTF